MCDGPVISHHFSSVKTHPMICCRKEFSGRSSSSAQNSTRLYFCVVVNMSVYQGAVGIHPKSRLIFHTVVGDTFMPSASSIRATSATLWAYIFQIIYFCDLLRGEGVFSKTCPNLRHIIAGSPHSMPTRRKISLHKLAEYFKTIYIMY